MPKLCRLKYQKDELVFFIFQTYPNSCSIEQILGGISSCTINGFAFKVLPKGLLFRKRESARSGVGNTEGSVISIVRLRSVYSHQQYYVVTNAEACRFEISEFVFLLVRTYPNSCLINRTDSGRHQ